MAKAFPCCSEFGGCPSDTVWNGIEFVEGDSTVFAHDRFRIANKNDKMMVRMVFDR